MPKDPKQLEAVAAIISASAGLLWAVVVLTVVLLFWRRVSALLQRETVEIEVVGVKLKTGLDVTRRVIAPLFDEITSVVKQLGERERKVFLEIQAKLEDAKFVESLYANA